VQLCTMAPAQYIPPHGFSNCSLAGKWTYRNGLYVYTIVEAAVWWSSHRRPQAGKTPPPNTPGPDAGHVCTGGASRGREATGRGDFRGACRRGRGGELATSDAPY
jgi:hypothetical protein